MLGAAAVALIEPHHVEAGGKRLVGEAAHVVRLARAFETVQRQQRRRGLTVRLPVAVRQHARVGGDVEIPGFGGGQARPAAAFGPTRRASSCGRRPSEEVACRSEYLNIIRRYEEGHLARLGWPCRRPWPPRASSTPPPRPSITSTPITARRSPTRIDGSRTTRPPETAAWVEAQNKVTFAYLDKIPYRAQLTKRLNALYNYAKYSSPSRKGENYFFSKNDGLQNQSVLYIQKGLTGTPEVLIDPNTWSEDGTVPAGGIRAVEGRQAR